MKVSLKSAWSGEADCLHCNLRSSVLFAGLEEADFECIHRPIDEVTLVPQTLLYRAGDPGHAVFTVRSGLLKLVQYLSDGTQRIVRLVHGTDVTGLEALLGQPYQHDAVVLQEASVCRLPIDVVRQLDRDNPRLHTELMNRWQRALNEADAWVTQMSTGTARQRVARLLLRLATRSEDEACDLFSREDVGAMLGITTETASRIVAEFKRRQILRATADGRFRCNTAALDKIASD